MTERLRLSTKTLDRYRGSLDMATKKFEAEAKPIIEKMQAYYRGNQWTVTKGDLSVPKIVVNLILSDIKVMLPMLALRNPRIFVKPTQATVRVPIPGPDGQPIMTAAQIINNQPIPVLAAARAKEFLINWRWRNLRINAQVRRCLTDSLLGPFGVMKLGYTFETEKIDAPTPTEEAEGEQGDVLQVNEAIKADKPYAVRWSPLDFRVDTEARYPDLSDASWVAFGWKARLEDVQRNPRYRNTRNLKATVEVKTDFGASGYIGDKSYLSVKEDLERVQLWEMWDRREGKILTLAEDHDKALEWRDWPSGHGTFPAETIVFTEHPDTLYGPPDLFQVLAQQDAYNEIASMILNHVKRFLRKYITSRGAFDEKELEKLMLPIDGLTIETDADVSKAIVPMPDAAIPVDWWQARGNFREDHDRVSGIADFIRGVAEKVDTATEANMIQSNLNVRTTDSRNIVEDFAERISQQLLSIDAQTLDIPTVIPVVGPDGAMALDQFFRIQTRETLLAETDVEVEIGSMRPIDEVSKKRDTMELFSQLRNDPLTDQFALRKQLVKVYHDAVPDGESLLIPKDMFQQVAATLQQQGQQQPPGARPPGPSRPPSRPPGGSPGPMEV